MMGNSAFFIGLCLSDGNGCGVVERGGERPVGIYWTGGTTLGFGIDGIPEELNWNSDPMVLAEQEELN
jgi:hypothetical protein